MNGMQLITWGTSQVEDGISGHISGKTCYFARLFASGLWHSSAQTTPVQSLTPEGLKTLILGDWFWVQKLVLGCGELKFHVLKTFSIISLRRFPFSVSVSVSVRNLPGKPTSHLLFCIVYAFDHFWGLIFRCWGIYRKIRSCSDFLPLFGVFGSLGHDISNVLWR